MNNEYSYPASSKSGSNTTAEQRGNWSRYACRVLSRVRLQSTLDSTIPGIFLWPSEKTLYPAGLVGIDRLERHLGLDIDDIVARQHSNWYRSRCWYLKIKFVILLLYYCLRYISSLAPPGRFSRALAKTGKCALGARFKYISWFYQLKTGDPFKRMLLARLICHFMLETILMKKRN